MQKSNLIFFSFALLSALILASCNSIGTAEIQLQETENPDIGDVATELPVVEMTESLALITSEPPGTITGAAEETQTPPPLEVLPDIPMVRLGSGDGWFQPTDPSQIQLASGRVQVFRFGAPW